MDSFFQQPEVRLEEFTGNPQTDALNILQDMTVSVREQIHQFERRDCRPAPMLAGDGDGLDCSLPPPLAR